MLFAFLTLGQWLILLAVLAVVGLVALPGTRPYARALVGSIRTALSCLVLCALLAVSSVAIYVDLEYVIYGVEAEATITKVDSGGKGRRVEYRFTEADGTARVERDAIDAGWTAPPNGTVTIQYIPGQPGHSRLSRYIGHWFPYALFVGSACLLIVVVALTARRVMKAARGPL